MLRIHRVQLKRTEHHVATIRSGVDLDTKRPHLAVTKNTRMESHPGREVRVRGNPYIGVTDRCETLPVAGPLGRLEVETTNEPIVQLDADGP